MVAGFDEVGLAGVLSLEGALLYCLGRKYLCFWNRVRDLGNGLFGLGQLVKMRDLIYFPFYGIPRYIARNDKNQYPHLG